MAVYVKFPSHRARDYAKRALGGALPQAYYIAFTSPRRNLRHYGIYPVTPEQLRVLRETGGHVRFTVLRPPYDDLQKCWE